MRKTPLLKQKNTVLFTGNIPLQLSFLCSKHGHLNLHSSTFAYRRLKSASTTQHFGSALDIAQPRTRLTHLTTQNPFIIKTFTIILNDEAKLSGGKLKRYFYVFGLGVFEDITQDFLHYSEKNDFLLPCQPIRFALNENIGLVAPKQSISNATDNPYLCGSKKRIE